MRALDARDPRFDGIFFVGITSTGIYCRPVCPAPPARRDRCRFFANAAAAERMGFRPCLRCRPELAPGLATVDAVSRVAHAAAARIAEGALNGRTVDELAAEFAISGRQLRRVVERHTGVSPIDLAQTHRLLLAKRLLTDTTLPMTRVAYASGFQSVRRFDALFQERYRLAPSALRRRAVASSAVAPSVVSSGVVASSPIASSSVASSVIRSGVARAPIPAESRPQHPEADISLTLGYRAPLAWNELLQFLAARATPGVEYVEGNCYARTVTVGDAHGWIRVRPADDVRNASRNLSNRRSLRVEIPASLTPILMPLLARLRALFDLDADPEAIDSALAASGLTDLVQARPGLRVPGAMDGFDLALRAVLGQQISVKGATTLAGRFAALFGVAIDTPDARLRSGVARATHIADATVAELRALGVTGARAESIWALARAVAHDGLRLDPGVDVEKTIAALQQLPGIGPWTAQYIAMRALRWPDAFPASDLWLRRTAGIPTAARLEKHSARWQPWRAYAAMHLWHAT